MTTCSFKSGDCESQPQDRLLTFDTRLALVAMQSAKRKLLFMMLLLLVSE